MRKFLFITFLTSWLLWSPPMLDSQDISIPGFLLPVSMLASFVPSLTGLFLIYREDGKAGLLEVWNKVIKLDFNKYWLVPTILLLPVTAAVSYFIGTRIFGGEGLDISANVIITAVVMFFIGGPLGEEFGWRGFLLNHLRAAQRIEIRNNPGAYLGSMASASALYYRLDAGICTCLGRYTDDDRGFSIIYLDFC
jgi:membrane protease YdiL (CAAX protease family)